MDYQETGHVLIESFNACCYLPILSVGLTNGESMHNPKGKTPNKKNTPFILLPSFLPSFFPFYISVNQEG
jgi:hypothetical protein